MAPEQRLIDVDAYPCQTCEVSHCYQNCNKFTKWFESTVDAVEVVHGRWDVEVGMNYNKERICSMCNKHIESNYWNYCPNCGARMDT